MQLPSASNVSGTTEETLKKQGAYRVKRLAVLSVLAVSAVVPGLVGCHRQEPDPRLQPQLVRLVRPRPSSELDHRDDFTGVVAARVESALGFRVPGKVTARLVDTGQVVRAGQALMRIDQADYGLALDAQTQNVEAARPGLSRPIPTNSATADLSAQEPSLLPPTIRSRRRPTKHRPSWRRRSHKKRQQETPQTIRSFWQMPPASCSKPWRSLVRSLPQDKQW